MACYYSGSSVVVSFFNFRHKPKRLSKERGKKMTPFI